MKRTATGFCLAAAFGCIATLGAQTSTATTASQPAPTPDKAGDVTITGCLSKSDDGKYMLTNAMVESPSAATATAGTSTTTAGATTGTTTGTTTSTTTSSAGAMSPAASSWMLAGGTDLDKHVGHKIQVTGRTSWNSTGSSRTPGSTTSSAAGTAAGAVGTSGTTATAATEEQRKDKDMRDQPRLDVQSVKMIAPSCS